MAFITNVNSAGLFPVITLTDSSSGTQAEIYSFGALLNKFSVKQKDDLVNIIDAFENPKDAIQEIKNGYKSAFLSPFTCRMNEGKYAFAQKYYQVEKSFLGNHAIHGLTFDVIFTVDKAETTDESASVQLSYQYNKDDIGYPFKYLITQIWKLELGNKLSVTTTVLHDNEHAIPYAQGWHPYFKLGETVDECVFSFTTDTHVEFDETLLPTGKTFKDNRFTAGVLLDGIFLDNCFLLTESEGAACTLQNSKLKLTISPDASYPYLQVYTPPHRKSIAIENLSGAPDCFNNGLGLLTLQPNEPATFSTSYTITSLI